MARAVIAKALEDSGSGLGFPGTASFVRGPAVNALFFASFSFSTARAYSLNALSCSRSRDAVNESREMTVLDGLGELLLN